MAARQQTSQEGEIKFSFAKVIDNTNRAKVIYSEVRDELSNLKNDNIQSKIQWASESNTVRTTTVTRRDRHQRVYTGDGRISKNLFQDNNAIAKKYLTTRIKSRNFLSNIAYVGINKEDYYNRNFVATYCWQKT